MSDVPVWIEGFELAGGAELYIVVLDSATTLPGDLGTETHNETSKFWRVVWKIGNDTRPA